MAATLTLGRHLLRAGLSQVRPWQVVRMATVVPKLPREPAYDIEKWYQPQEGEDLKSVPLPHSLMRFQFMQDPEKLEKGIWPWETGIRGRLPDHYKQHYMEFYTRKAVPVHYVADLRKYSKDEYGTRWAVQNEPIPLYFPNEANSGLWGGEGFVVGLRKRHNKSLKPRTPRIWKPMLHRRVFHSEILDQYMEITVTLRTLDLVDAAFGFDHYILKTPSIDMRSKLGMVLKRNMLLTLVNKSMYADDLEKCEAVYEKYKEFVIPAEEAEWIGLTLEEAEKKQQELEESENPIRPLKMVFAEELIEKLRENRLDDDDDDDDNESSSKGWLSKLNPFKDEKS